MKKIATIAAVLGLSASAALAGGLSDPMVEGEPIAAPAAAGSASGPALIGGLLLLGLAVAAGSSSSGT